MLRRSEVHGSLVIARIAFKFCAPPMNQGLHSLCLLLRSAYTAPTNTQLRGPADGKHGETANTLKMYRYRQTTQTKSVAPSDFYVTF